MKIIPKVKSLNDVKAFRSTLQRVKVQFIQFQAHAVNNLAETLILRTIHERMRDFGYSEKIIQGTIVSGVDIVSKRKFRISFHSEYFAANGFDVALARERDGTVSHFIAPKNKKALRFDQNKFSKGHEVSGIIPSHIIENTLDEIGESFFDSYNNLERTWLEQNFGGLAVIGF